jgi:hypothetical protein
MSALTALAFALPLAATAGAQGWAVDPAWRERPPLMEWQRTLDDGLALSKETGKPLLICVNADGEPASENLAWGRYRDPAFVELARGFVCVLASPDRHWPRDRDDAGRRLTDPRFGRLVSSEHIDIEPLLYEAYFSGRRVAPRHVGVSPEGEVLFDLFLLNDLTKIDDALREHGVTGGEALDPASMSDDELLASVRASHRSALEARFVAAGDSARARLAAAALSADRAAQHPELVRMGLRDPEAEVRAAALDAVTANASGLPQGAWAGAFFAAQDLGGDASELAGAFARAAGDMSDDDRGKEARRLAVCFEGLSAPSQVVDLGVWRASLDGTPVLADVSPGADEFDAVVGKLQRLEVALGEAPEDPELLLALAREQIRFGRVQLAGGGNPSFTFQDAVASAGQAVEAGADDGRGHALLAWASWLAGEQEGAAAAAAQALPRLAGGGSGGDLEQRTLELFARVRRNAIYTALQDGDALEAAWVSDAVAAHEALSARTGTGEAEWKQYLELLGSVSAFHAQERALAIAIAQAPVSGDMHNWLRFQMLRDRGAAGLERAYGAPGLAGLGADTQPTVDWFRGLAVFVAAERFATDRAEDDAFGAYGRSAEHYTRSAEAAPDFVSSANHYIVLAHAARARILLAGDQLEQALAELVLAIEVAPENFEAVDGFGEGPATTTKAAREAFARERRDDLEAELKAALVEAGIERAPASTAPSE